jgi:hypothetical protein
MSYFAKVTNGIVTRVIAVSAEYIENYVDSSPGEWIQTSYNTRGGVHYDPETREPSADQSKALRYNYAGIGFIYDKNADAFYSPQPFPSWTLNTTSYTWEAPVAYPDDGEVYEWNEETQTWDAE